MALKRIKKNIGIIGSGISGLACAYFLADKGYSVTIYEREKGPGGLAGSAQVNGVPIEMFYHHFFSSDTELLAMAKELGVYDLNNNNVLQPRKYIKKLKMNTYGK